jgi:hypothetical protein
LNSASVAASTSWRSTFLLCKSSSNNPLVVSGR